MKGSQAEASAHTASAAARVATTARAGHRRFGRLSPARPYKRAMQKRFTVENAKGTERPRRARTFPHAEPGGEHGAAPAGTGRIVALYRRSSTPYQMR
jgi:hypothetical protein